MAPRNGKSCGLPKQTPHLIPYYLHEKNSPLELPRAIRQCTLKGCVGNLKDGYVHNVPLPRVPRIQSAKLIAPSICNLAGTTPSRCIQVGTPLPDYLPASNWIPTLPKLCSILGFSQRVLWPFSPIAIKAKNNRLSSAHSLVKTLEQSTLVEGCLWFNWYTWHYSFDAGTNIIIWYQLYNDCSLTNMISI